MSDSFYSETVVKKTRKDHNCSGCLKKIPAGTENVRKSCGVFEGEFWSAYLCETCDGYLNNPDYRGAFEEGWYFGGIPTIVSDWRRENGMDDEEENVSD